MPNLDRIAEAKRVLQLEGEAILEAAKRLDSPKAREQFEKALDLLLKSLQSGGKIVITGVGKSGKICQKTAATMCSTGSLAVFLHPTDGLHGDLGLISSKDAVIAISQGGNTEELVRLLPSLKKLQVPLIALTGNPSSQLAQAASAWIDTSIAKEACPHNLAPTTSTTLAMALGDALAVTLMQLTGFDAKGFAQNHPGGGIGKRLSLTVADVMHSGAQVATAGQEAPMEEIVVKSTQARLGAVLIVDGKKLLGIITDGDIRKALSHQKKFFDFKAHDVMTRSPVTIRSDLMAQEALNLLENRPHQLSALPVVDESGNWVGLVRIHDLVRSL